MASLDSAQPNQMFHNAGFRFSHMLTAGFGYHLGYGYGQASFQGVTNTNAFHNIDVGLMMNRALSITRRTKFSFSTGTTINRNGVVGANGSAVSRADHSPNLIGQANLTHNIARSWNARIAYRAHLADHQRHHAVSGQLGDRWRQRQADDALGIARTCHAAARQAGEPGGRLEPRRRRGHVHQLQVTTAPHRLCAAAARGSSSI
jgi:hypothetical protein